MNFRKLLLVLTPAVLLLQADLSLALQPKADEPPATIGGMQSTPRSKKALAERRKAAAKVKRVDVNNATARDLKKLPGIGDAEAERIIAGRPYGSKAWLVTKKIIPDGIYINIKNRIFVGPPYKDDVKNQAFYNSLKKP